MGENKIKQLLTSVQKPGSLVLLAVLLFGSIFPQSFALPVKTAEAATGVPLLINFQGRLTNVTGGTNVANGTYNIRFKIYDALSGGSLLWTETRDQAPVHACQKVQVTAGVFNVKLGSCNSLSTVDFTSDSLYLSVDFDGGSGYDGEMSPRKQLVSAPYAINANNVAGNGKIDLTNTATTTVPFKLTANTLTTASGLTLTTTNNSAANTAWTGATLTFNNSQATTAVSSGSIAGLDIQFNQNTAIAGNTETAARINIKQNDSSSTDAAVASLLDLANNDTATGNQITVTDALRINGANVTNGINLSGTFASNLITSTNFTVAQSGQITSGNLAGGGTQCLQASNTGVISGTGGTCGGTTTLQQAYGYDVDGSDATISLTTADDSIVITNPSSSGTDSTFTFKIDQAASGAVDALSILNAGTGTLILADNSNASGNGVSIDVQSSSASQYGLRVTANNGATNALWVGGDGRVGIGTTVPGTALDVIGAGTFQRNSIGTTSTDGLILSNSTAASVGAQQYSPRLRLTGQGWKTDATAASQTVDWIMEARPVQGAANPTVNLAILAQVNGGGYTSAIAPGQILAPGGASTSQAAPQYSAINNSAYGLKIGGGNAGNAVALVGNNTSYLNIDANVNAIGIKSNATLRWGAENFGTTQVSLSSPSNDNLLLRDSSVTGPGNFIIGSTSTLPGTSGKGVLVVGLGTVPTSSPADIFQIYAADYAAGDTRAFLRTESGTAQIIGNNSIGSAPSTGTDTAGTNFSLFGGQGTGTGIGGNVVLQAAYPSTTGSTANSLTDVFTILASNKATSGTQNLVSITPTVNQSSTAAYNALLVNVTETATGSGAKNLLKLQVGGVDQFNVSNAGVITSASLAGGGTLCLQTDNNGVISPAAAACGTGGSTTLQQAYGFDADGSDATISLTTADDSIIVTNPSSSGTDSTFTFKIDQAASGAVDALIINNAGTGTLGTFDASNATGNGLSIDIQSSSASQYALKVTANNGSSNALWVGGDGRVGIGDTSPASLFTVGANDLFQINTTGEIGAQVSPNTDYLFGMTGSNTKDYSRIIDIIQANDSAEDNYGISIVNTVNPGTISGGTTRTIRNTYASLTPTATVQSPSGGIARLTVYGSDQTISLSNTTLGSTASNAAYVITTGNSVAISGTPVINNTDASGDNAYHLIYGDSNTITLTPTLTSVNGATGNYYASYNTASITSAGNANYAPSVYGVYSTAGGNLTTTGTTSHYAGYFATTGTADDNFGLSVSAAGGTNNYGIAISNPTAASTNYAIYSTAPAQSYFAGNIGIGTTVPDSQLHIGATTGSLTTSTSINVSKINFASASTIAGSGAQIYGQFIDMSNITGAADTAVVASAKYLLPSQTNSTINAYNYVGATVSGGTLTMNNASGALNYTGFQNTSPAIVGTNGSVIANGFKTTNGTVTTTGTQAGLDITTSTITTAGNQYGVNVNAVGVGAGTLNALKISNITAGAGTENAIQIGTGWDKQINGNGWSVDGSGALTVASCTGCGGGSGSLDSITAAAADDTNNDNTNKQIAWDWSTPTTQTAFKLQNTGTGLTSGSIFNVSSATTSTVATNGIVSLNASGNYSSTSNVGLLQVAANATTAGTVAKFSGTALTTGTGVFMTGGTAMTTGSLLQLASTTYNHGNATETGNLLNIAFTDATNGTATSTTNGINITPTINVTTGASGAKTINGIKISAPTLTACTGGSTCTYAGLNVDTSGTLANTTIYSALFSGGNVGIGDTTPLSLFTVGSGDLFQINTTGEIGSQVSPNTDYQFGLTASTSKDYSRIIDINQANDSDESSRAISVTSTVNLGSIAANRQIYNNYSSLTPTISVGDNRLALIYGNYQDISLSNITHGTVTGTASRSYTYGNYATISGSPVLNDATGGDQTSLRAYGTSSFVAISPILTSVIDGNITTAGGYFSDTSTSPGNSNLLNTSYGVYGAASGNLTTTGSTTHYGGFFTSTGTADMNYGVYASASGGTNNYSGVFTGGNFGIGVAQPTQLLHVQDGTALINFSGNFTPTTLAGGFDTSGQNINSVFVAGKYAFVGQSTNAGTCSGTTVTGCEFSIWDIHNPNNPLAVSGVNIASTVKTIYVSGKYAVLGRIADAGTCTTSTITGCELMIYDITNPNSPTLLSVDGGFNQDINSLFIQGKLLFVAANTDNSTGTELKIYDLSNPGTLAVIGSINTGDATSGEGAIKSVYVQGRYMYLGLSSTTGTACTSGDATSCDFRIYDINDPFNPTFKGGANTGADVNTVSASGKYAYLGAATDGSTNKEFDIYNIADPTAPTETAGINYDVTVQSIQIQGKYAYVGRTSASGNDFRIVDITDPTATPVDAGGSDITFDVKSVFVSGKYAYIGIANTADSAKELRVLDIAGVDTPTITTGNAGIGNLQVSDNARIDSDLHVAGSINVGLGGIQSSGPISIENTLQGNSSGNGVAGIYGNYTFNNTTSGVFQYGNRFISNITAVEDSNVDSTYIGQLIRIVDTDCDTGATTLDCDNTVRGLEVQSWTGNNTAGTNTAIAGFGKTFGVSGTTDALAGGVAQPAAIFADLDNGSATTVGNAIRAYTDNATSADLVQIYQETSAYTGTGLLMNFGNNSGSYTGNFIDLQKAGSSKWKINYNNGTDITTETYSRTGSIIDFASATNGNTFIWKVPQKATTGQCATGTAEGIIFQDTGGTQRGHMCINGPSAPLRANKLEFWAEVFNATSTDLAENYSDIANTLTPGDVVAFDTTTDKAITQATAQNSEFLAGIVSTSPGLLLTDENEDNIGNTLVNAKPLAISGRVPVKVSDENGIVKKGDHLTVSLTKPGYAMKAKKAGITLGQAISDSKDGSVTVFVNLTTWNGQTSSLPVSTAFTKEYTVPIDLLDQLSKDDSDYLSTIFTDRIVARDVVSDTISANTLNIKDLKFIEQDGLTADTAFIMKGGLKVDSISSITDLITFNNDVEFIGTPFFNKDSAGFAKIIAGTKEIRVEFEKEYLVKPIITANLTFERDENTREDDQIKNEELDIQAAFSGVQFVIINKNTKGFTILLNKKAPRDLSFSWIALAVKDANTFTSKDLTAEEKAQEQTQEQEQIKEQTPTEESINTTEETKTDATQSTKENSDKNEKIKVETKEEAGTKEQ